MNVSLFDLFKIGVGPSSSHTMSPMLAGKKFSTELQEQRQLHHVKTLTIDLYGSLALTGKEHGTDVGCILGLIGKDPDTITPDEIETVTKDIKSHQQLALKKERFIHFDWDNSILFHKDTVLPEHPSGMKFTARGAHGEVLHRRTFFSISGGFIVGKGDTQAQTTRSNITPPYPFSSATELLALCKTEKKSIAEIVFANELALEKRQDPSASIDNIHQKLDLIWKTMAASIDRGTIGENDLPGELKRRAKKLQESIIKRTTAGKDIDTDDWVNLFAMAVSEENAAGNRIVAAPSNGAAGVIPAVIAYYNNFVSPDKPEQIRIFLATAAAIGFLYKNNPSLSTPNLGCQGEVGVACSMAAAGLAAAKGGTPEEIENAAEIGMEHNLGLTCDPLNGSVQIPCIERNTMAAVKAINAVRLAFTGGAHYVSLDTMIKTMHKIGLEMGNKYKEASDKKEGVHTIPINVIEC